MQRYSIECDDVGPLGVAKDDDGEYVRYNEVAAKLAAADRLAAALREIELLARMTGDDRIADTAYAALTA